MNSSRSIMCYQSLSSHMSCHILLFGITALLLAMAKIQSYMEVIRLSNLFFSFDVMNGVFGSRSSTRIPRMLWSPAVFAIILNYPDRFDSSFWLRWLLARPQRDFARLCSSWRTLRRFYPKAFLAPNAHDEQRTFTTPATSSVVHAWTCLATWCLSPLSAALDRFTAWPLRGSHKTHFLQLTVHVTERIFAKPKRFPVCLVFGVHTDWGWTRFSVSENWELAVCLRFRLASLRSDVNDRSGDIRRFE